MKKQEIINHKNRAINALKNKAKAQDDEESDDDDEIVEEKIDKSYVDKKNEEILVGLSLDKNVNDEAEKKLIKYHYNNSIIKTGDIAKDLKNARAIANEHIIESIKKTREEAARNESEMTGYSAGIPKRELNASDKGGPKDTPVNRAAAALLDKIDPEAKKYL